MASGRKLPELSMPRLVCQTWVYRCSRCGESVLFAYDHLPLRRIRDFPWAGRPCELEVSLARVECPACHAIAVEAAEWVESYGRQTERYERYVAGLCSLMPAPDVADLEGLDKTTVYRIDKKWLERREALRPDHPVTRMGIDEIAIRKGQKYATVFYDLERREVIGMTLTRKERAVSRFFRRWRKPRVHDGFLMEAEKRVVFCVLMAYDARP